MAEATPPAQDWSSFSEDDASWLEGLDISSDLQGAIEGEVDWLVPSDTAPTLSTGATTATLHNLDDLGGLFQENVGQDFNLSENLQFELDQWELEALTGSGEDSEWTDVPISLSSIAQKEEEARELAAWDEKDRVEQSLNSSLEFDPESYVPVSQDYYLSGQNPSQYSESYLEALGDQNLGPDPAFPDWSETAPLWSGTIDENSGESYGGWSPDLPAPSYLDAPSPFQLDDELDVQSDTELDMQMNFRVDTPLVSPHPYQQEPVSQSHFKNPPNPRDFVMDAGNDVRPSYDAYDNDRSAFEMGIDEVNSPDNYSEDFSENYQDNYPENYLGNFELESAAINLNLDIDLEDFRSSATISTPPLHETFTGSNLPQITTMPDTPTTGGDSKWSNKQMSTGLNPDRKPFEPAPPSLIMDTTGTPPEMNSIDIFDMDQNTDWSGLLEQSTNIVPTNAPAVLPHPPAPKKPEIQKKPRPVAPNPPAKSPAPVLPPPNLPRAKAVEKVPDKVLHQEVRQFQQLLDDSNLSAVATKRGIQVIEEPIQPLHEMSDPPNSDKLAQKRNLQFSLPKMPQLPWLQIGKIAGLGLGAIALVWGGSMVLDRPVTQFGLRIGLWKDVSARDLSGMDLSGGNMRGANLSKANLRGANLENADLSIANLSEADLTGARLTRATIRGTNFQGTKIGRRGTREETRLDREALLVWQAVNERLDGLNMSRLNLLGVNLNNASLIRANLSNSTLSFATFRGANLTGANLRGAILESADFSDANLTGAIFTNANFGRNPPTSSKATTCPDRRRGPCNFERFR